MLSWVRPRLLPSLHARPARAHGACGEAKRPIRSTRPRPQSNGTRLGHRSQSSWTPLAGTTGASSSSSTYNRRKRSERASFWLNPLLSSYPFQGLFPQAFLGLRSQTKQTSCDSFLKVPSFSKAVSFLVHQKLAIFPATCFAFSLQRLWYAQQGVPFLLLLGLARLARHRERVRPTIHAAHPALAP